MRAEIIGLSQEMNLLNGAFNNQLRLQLADNTVITAVVDDAAVALVTSLFARTGGAAVQRVLDSAAQYPPPQQPAGAPTYQPMGPEDASGNEEFGGDYGGSDGQVEEEYEVRQPPSPAPAGGVLQVSADERGNPVISGRNVRDTQDILGAGEEEEDGVASL